MEKQHRLAEDITATKKCCTAILDVLYQAKEWKLLNEHILLLAKRRSQLKQVLHRQLCILPLCNAHEQSDLIAAACTLAGSASLRAAGHGVHRAHTRQGDARGAHKDAAVCHRGQGGLLSRLLKLHAWQPCPATLLACCAMPLRRMFERRMRAGRRSLSRSSARG